MSVFDPIGDSAFALKTEGQEIKLTFKQGVPATGQGTVEWNIPTPAHGCNSGEAGAYAGILILLRTEPLDASNIPQDGEIYVADPTADADLSTADKIGDAFVVGVFYEAELKAQNGTLTTSLVINNIKPNTAYYIGGYAVDAQYRYHSEGVRAYSDSYGDKAGTGIPSYQHVKLGTNGSGILPTDGTGLLPGATYEFDIIVDNSFPTGYDYRTIQVSIDGINAGTYQDLVDEINKQMQLSDNPPQSPVPPNTNSFYWDPAEEQLYQFDGTTHDKIDAIVEPTDPAVIAMGTYWYDSANKVLNRNNIPNPTGWNVINHIEGEYDLTNPECSLYWYNGTIGRKWDSTTWCNQITLVSAEDPSICPTVQCGTYWYNEAALTLYKWNETTIRWDEKSAIYWPEAPNTLSDGTYWFNDTSNKLNLRVGSTWSDITSTSIISEIEPTTLTDGLVWYKSSTEELKIYSTSLSAWVDTDILVWAEDPTDVNSCDLWWNSTNDELKVWDVVNNEWDLVISFVISSNDPSQITAIVVDTLWYNTTDSSLTRWDGSDWVAVDFIEKITDPTVLVMGDAWYNPTTNEWKVYNTPASGWNIINPIDSPFDPTSIPNNTYWYDTTNNALFVRNGTTWTTVTFSTIPYFPIRKSMWYDTSENILKMWDGTAWVEAEYDVSAYINPAGGITFRTTKLGSSTAILIPTPPGSVSEPVVVGTGFADFTEFDINPVTGYTYERDTTGRVYSARLINDGSFLWSNLSPYGKLQVPTAGNDGKSGVPSYMEIGVGTDGTPDERRELMDSLRAQLGYPAIKVELTNYQLDTAIQNALETFRTVTGSAYRRGFYFLNIEPGKQQYIMTNRVMGYHRIVNVTAAYRFTSAFLSSAHGSGVYGQVVLQHLYNMGTFDLTSFHLVAQYVEQLEHLFATRLTHTFHENNRVLSFFNSFTRPERVLLDCMIERTEQDLFKDRLTKRWIERYALSEAMLMLAQIRGKFSSLPGAGGGISLNASELITQANTIREKLEEEVDNYIVDTPEDVGQYSTFILG